MEKLRKNMHSTAIIMVAVLVFTIVLAAAFALVAQNAPVAFAVADEVIVWTGEDMMKLGYGLDDWQSVEIKGIILQVHRGHYTGNIYEDWDDDGNPYSYFGDGTFEGKTEFDDHFSFLTKSGRHFSKIEFMNEDGDVIHTLTGDSSEFRLNGRIAYVHTIRFSVQPSASTVTLNTKKASARPCLSM